MRYLTLSVVLLGAAVLGCSSSGKSDAAAGPSETDALTEVGGMIRSYVAETGRGPAKVADLSKHQTEFPNGWKALQAGQVVVVWGGKVAGEGEGSGGSKAVVAYLKAVPESGGAVFLENGTVQQMTAAEFAAAPKAKK
jgi:hypothetical protein